MRRVLAGCGVLSLLLASCGKDGAPDRSSPEGMARVAFRALRDGDLESLRGTLVTAEQMRAVYERQGAAATPEARAQAEERVARRGGFEAMAKKEADGAMRRFSSAREAAAKDFDWAGAEFAGLAPLAKERSEGGLQFARVVFRVSAGGKTYEFASNDSTRIDGAWTFPEGLSYLGEIGREEREAARRTAEAERQMAGMLVSQARESLQRLVGDVESYARREGRLPAALTDPGVLLSPPFPDPWGTPFGYEVLDGGKQRFLLRSAGPDKSLGTPDDVTVESGVR